MEEGTKEKVLTTHMFFATKTSGPRGRIRSIRRGRIIEIHGIELCQGCQWLKRISAGKAGLCKTCQPQMDQAKALREKLSKKYGMETR